MEKLKEFGEIIKVDEHFVTIKVQPVQSECHDCAMAAFCTGENDAKKLEIFKDQLTFRPQCGQKVELCFNKVLEYSLLVYLLPVLFFLLTILISNQIFKVSEELHLFIYGLLGLVLGFFVLRFVNNLVKKKGLNIEIKLLGER